MTFLLRATCLAVGLLLAGTASANGRFPQAGQITVQDGDPQRLLVRATFGLLRSDDAGTSWGWICEAAPGYQDQTDPYALLLGTGRMALATTSGLIQSKDGGCNWLPAAGGLGAQATVDLVAIPNKPTAALALVAGPVSTSTGLYTPSVWRTDDGGAQWSQLSTLPPLVQVLTIEVAASDPARVYVSGVAAVGGKPRPQVLRSDDAGLSWTAFDPGGAGTPWLAAVDPTDADRVWLRRSAPGLGDTLARSDDGGTTWSDVFAADGSLRGFALSPDGGSWLAGVVGAGAGLYRGSADAVASPTQLDSRGIHALRWTTAGVYAAGADAEGFAVAYRPTPDSPWQVLLRHADLVPLVCPKGSLFAEVCPQLWPAVAKQLGASPSSTATSSGTTSGGCAASRSSDPATKVGGGLSLLALLGLAQRRRRARA